MSLGKSYLPSNRFKTRIRTSYGSEIFRMCGLPLLCAKISLTREGLVYLTVRDYEVLIPWNTK